MTPLLQQMTAAAMIPPVRAFETWARLVSRAAWQWNATLARAAAGAQGADAPLAAEAEESEAREAVLDRAAEAMEETAEAVETAAAGLVGVPPAEHGGDDAARGDAPGDDAAPHPVDGGLTAADEVADAFEPAAPEGGHHAHTDTADLVREATGEEPRSLEEMLPHNTHPAE